MQQARARMQQAHAGSSPPPLVVTVSSRGSDDLIKAQPVPPFFPRYSTAEERDEISEVLPGALYLSSWRGAINREALDKLGVTHVVSVGSEFVEEAAAATDGLVHWVVDIEDTVEEGTKMREALTDSVELIRDAISAGGAVCTHCAAGASRSAAVVLAYLISAKALEGCSTLRDAFAHLQSRRPCVWPNDGFMSVLLKLEEKLKGTPSLNLKEYATWGEYEDEDVAEASNAVAGVRERLAGLNTGSVGKAKGKLWGKPESLRLGLPSSWQRPSPIRRRNTQPRC